jgi:Protein of unknown function (DUF2281)
MKTREVLLKEIANTPETLLGEVLDFLEFLKAKHQQEQQEVVLLSESALAKDWLKPEEDEAWQNL